MIYHSVSAARIFQSGPYVIADLGDFLSLVSLFLVYDQIVISRSRLTGLPFTFKHNFVILYWLPEFYNLAPKLLLIRVFSKV